MCRRLPGRHGVDRDAREEEGTAPDRAEQDEQPPFGGAHGGLNCARVGHASSRGYWTSRPIGREHGDGQRAHFRSIHVHGEIELAVLGFLQREIDDEEAAGIENLVGRIDQGGGVAVFCLVEVESQLLHDQITRTLNQYGVKNAFGKGDYWLLDDNWGWERQQVEVQNLNLLRPHVIKELQTLLAKYPNWDITVRVDVPGKEKIWPGMCVIIYHDEIIDELQREFFPEEFRNMTYEGGRPFVQRG